MEVAEVNVLKSQKDAPRRDLDYADYCTQHCLQVHFLVKKSQNDSNNNENTCGNGEGEGNYLRCLAELLVVFLLCRASQEVIGNHKAVGASAEAKVIVEIVPR